MNVQIERSHRGGAGSRTFKGEVYTNLESSKSVFWTVNGDFIAGGSQNGETSASMSLGIGDVVTLKFTVTVSGKPKSTYYSVRHNRAMYSGACPMKPSFDDLVCGNAK